MRTQLSSAVMSQESIYGVSQLCPGERGVNSARETRQGSPTCPRRELKNVKGVCLMARMQRGVSGNRDGVCTVVGGQGTWRGRLLPGAVHSEQRGKNFEWLRGEGRSADSLGSDVQRAFVLRTEAKSLREGL